VRMLLLGYQNGAGVGDLRRCPFCGLVWAKFQGCDGTMNCGNRPSQGFDARSTMMGRFHFRFDGSRLHITKIGSDSIGEHAQSGTGVGCGNRIEWSQMTPVRIPRVFRVLTAVTTDDVEILPGKARSSFKRVYDSVQQNLGPIMVAKPKQGTESK